MYLLVTFSAYSFLFWCALLIYLLYQNDADLQIVPKPPTVFQAHLFFWSGATAIAAGAGALFIHFYTII